MYSFSNSEKGCRKFTDSLRNEFQKNQCQINFDDCKKHDAGDLRNLVFSLDKYKKRSEVCADKSSTISLPHTSKSCKKNL